MLSHLLMSSEFLSELLNGLLIIGPAHTFTRVSRVSVRSGVRVTYYYGLGAPRRQCSDAVRSIETTCGEL